MSGPWPSSTPCSWPARSSPPAAPSRCCGSPSASTCKANAGTKRPPGPDEPKRNGGRGRSGSRTPKEAKVSRFPAEGLLADLEALVIRESPSDDAAAVTTLAHFIVERLRAAGVRAETRSCPPRGDAVLATVGEGDGGLLLLGHHDTVWPKGTLAEIPFGVEDGRVRGPGVFDMKAGIALAMAVLADRAKGETACPGVPAPHSRRGDRHRGLATAPPRGGKPASRGARARTLAGGRGQGRAKGHGNLRGALPGARRPRGPRSREGRFRPPGARPLHGVRGRPHPCRHRHHGHAHGGAERSQDQRGARGGAARHRLSRVVAGRGRAGRDGPARLRSLATPG